ncbi:MAG TPA: methyltransferase domain-containing protein [Candidatus Hydrogenedentes bacterium]|nr:methyltransferase domain-containing protein [Candidatus Hydrogenedentota bacterium]HPG67987.1 methyltransferase domain-containing protein [Candidatus Hydrogenedentota bacterium]
MNRVRDYYAENPLMVSSPFGGVDGLNHGLVDEVFGRLGINVAARRVLDVGCGRGFMAEYVRGHGGAYIGVDFVASRHEAPLALADAAALPFTDASFDAVFCVDAFEHFPDDRAAAAEFRRVLAPGGFVFLSVPNYANVAGVVKKLCEATGRYARNTWAPFRHWQAQELERFTTAASVRRAFGEAGFTRFTRVAHGPEVGLGLCPWIEHRAMPEAVKFRLQRLFVTIGPAIARAWPGASLHGFWKIEV